ncbi:endonuclease [Comamonas serinivorans]|uniref:Endonuclease n=2 Tax=Comamonas serinivorans TaxID=1082851 RepID=A0A1Y0EPL6_9BURK|nr:endonuclease [Comamonas serinivorans]
MPSSSAWRELCFNSFAVLHNADTKTPVFVVERLNKASLRAAQNQQRTDQFYPEARLPFSHRAQLDDYRGSGYARGHLAPAADMSSPQAMAQSFSLANIVPQDPAHNAGAWLKIEQDTRQYVKRARGDVFVFSGPVYSGRSRAIGPGRVAVPTHLFKLVYDASTGRAWAHWQANDPKARVTAPLSYADFVQKTGLRLLASAQAAHALP